MKKTLTPGVILTLPWGYIYISILVKQVYWCLRSQRSVYRTIGALLFFFLFFFFFTSLRFSIYVAKFAISYALIGIFIVYLPVLRSLRSFTGRMHFSCCSIAVYTSSTCCSAYILGMISCF